MQPQGVASRRRPFEMADLAAALRANRVAQAHFDAMSASHRRDYIEWLVDAKREETRRKRFAAAIEWIGEGKSKEWKYRRTTLAVSRLLRRRAGEPRAKW